MLNTVKPHFMKEKKKIITEAVNTYHEVKMEPRVAGGGAGAGFDVPHGLLWDFVDDDPSDEE